MINYGAAWERYYELADRRNKEGLTFDEVVAVVNASRPTAGDNLAAADLSQQLYALTASEQRYAVDYLWGAMTIRDPDACRDALKAAVGW